MQLTCKLCKQWEQLLAATANKKTIEQVTSQFSPKDKQEKIQSQLQLLL